MTYEHVIEGIGISRGLGVGRPHLHIEKIQETSTAKWQSHHDELFRFRDALEKTKYEILHLQSLLNEQGHHDLSPILDAHFELIHDPMILSSIEAGIASTENKQAEHILKEHLAVYHVSFMKKTSAIHRDRFQDVKEVFEKIIYHLEGKKKQSLLVAPVGSVIFADEIRASEMAEIDRASIQGIVTCKGGYSSHVGIMARAKKIPHVMIKKLQDHAEFWHSIAPGHFLEKVECTVIDGNKGLVIFNPTTNTLEQFKKNSQPKRSRYVASLTPLSNITLLSNIEQPKEATQSFLEGAAGVGLVRTEFAFDLLANHAPSIAEQKKYYRKFAKISKDKPIVLRLFDLGGDKQAHWKELTCVENDDRGISLLLKNREVLKNQLKSILEAFSEAHVKLLVPMLQNLGQILELKKEIDSVLEKVKKKPIKIDLGAMIEVPQLVPLLKTLKGNVDFFSIGSNDLIEQATGTSRNDSTCQNANQGPFYQLANPSIIALLDQIAKEARYLGMPLSICGEIAADTKAVIVLLALGIQTFSVAPCHLAVLDSFLRTLPFRDAIEEKRKELLDCTSREEIFDWISSFSAR